MLLIGDEVRIQSIDDDKYNNLEGVIVRIFPEKDDMIYVVDLGDEMDVAPEFYADELVVLNRRRLGQLDS